MASSRKRVDATKRASKKVVPEEAVAGRAKNPRATVVKKVPVKKAGTSKPSARGSTTVAKVHVARVATNSSSNANCVDRVLEAALQLREQVSCLNFSPTVPWVYNPLDYAWQAHREYIERFVKDTCQVLFVGMNPGPWGMTQTGIPFGQIEAAKGWLGIRAAIEKPNREHPKRPIEGWQCKRSEVSGERLWGLFRSRYREPERFFETHFVANYCPLVFMEESARNLTPDKLPKNLAVPLQQVCDRHLAELIKILEPDWVIGVGAFAEEAARRVANSSTRIGRILHPSPASPAANRDWAGVVTKQLQSLGIWK